MKNNEIDLIFSETTDLTKDKTYIVNCEEYTGVKLTLRTGYFDRSIIKGLIKNLNTELNTCSMVYTEITFENCVFNDKSWIDSSSFNGCKFINCNFYGDFRWITFDKCSFENTHFNMTYMRATTLKKNCIFNNVTIKTKQIDEYIWVFGKRYSELSSNDVLKF